MTDIPHLERLFAATRGIPAGAAREAHLDEVCGGDAALRAQLDILLELDLEASGVLGQPVAPGAGDEEGTAAAVGAAAAELERFRRLQGAPAAPPQGQSVLQALETLAGAPLSVHLNAPEESGAPVSVTEEVKRLREPSGRYQLLGEIGRGGVGVVYKGRDKDLGRDVAMKMLKEELAARPDVLARFVEEAQIGGQLQHPGIVPVYELGLQKGERPYFAMKLVKGETLATRLARRSSPAEERHRLLAVFEDVCQTMAYAHSRSVIHRDLKPANVMIGAFGEVQVVDWGFAKVLVRGAQDSASDTGDGQSVLEVVRVASDTGSHSLAGSMMGTPAYMSPEQALGDRERLDERSDVFGLGAILCEILSGQPPYVRADGELVRQAASAALEPARTRLAQCGADAELVALCTECLAPSRAARPASALALAQRVEEYRASVEQRARQSELRALRARHTQRTTLFSALAALVVLAMGLGGWLWLEGEARGRRASVAARVAEARTAADIARGEASAAGLDAGRWETALARSESLVSLASDADPDALAEAEALLAAVRAEGRAAAAEVQRLERDRWMLDQLVRLRIPPDLQHLSTDGVLRTDRAGRRELQRLDADYAEAFARYVDGLSLLDGQLEASLAALQRGEIELELAAALDHWGLIRNELAEVSGSAPDPRSRLHELAVRIDPDNEWRTQLRALLPRAAQEGEALAQLAERADLRDLGAAGCRVLAEALGHSGRRQAVVGVLRLATDIFPHDFDLVLRLACGFERVHPSMLQEAYEAFLIAQGLEPENEDVRSRAIRDLLALNRMEEAERVARARLERDPTSAAAWRDLGFVQSRRRQPAEAEVSLQRALELDSDDDLTLEYLATALTPIGRQDEALVYALRAVELEPENSAPHFVLSLCLGQLDRHAEALAQIRRARELLQSELDGTLLFNEAIYLQHLGRPDEALECLRRAVEIEPTFEQGHQELGLSLRDAGHPDEAIEHLRRALELGMEKYRGFEAPEKFLATTEANLGLLLASRGDAIGALGGYRRACELDPDREVLFLFLRVELLSRLERTDEAEDSLEHILELAPWSLGATARGQEFPTHDSHAKALWLLAGIHFRRGDWERCEECCEAALDIAPDYPHVRHMLAVSLLNRGLHDEAVAQSEQSIEDGELEHVTCAFEIEQTMADAHMRLQEPEAALRYLRSLFEHPSRFPGSELPSLYWSSYPTNLYNAACLAARMGSARSGGAVDAVTRRGLHEESRGWLRLLVEEGASDLLAGCASDPDLASVRGEALLELPADEGAAWEELWAAVECSLPEQRQD